MTTSDQVLPDGVQILESVPKSQDFILSSAALDFLALLERTFRKRRQELLNQREIIQESINQGIYPTFLNSTEHIRSAEWQVAQTPPDLQNRRVEITGPTDRKMVINALNSGANIFMADFEDANCPTWDNLVSGQVNLFDAVRRKIKFDSPDGKEYRLNDQVAVLLVRPRGWHLPERHVLVDGKPMSGALFDFGLYFFHNARELLQRDSGPYFYLAKLENHQEANLWNDVFVLAQESLGIPVGTIRATVLIENVLAAFEMEEILYVLREHSAGLNAGRWDYIFSVIKKFNQKEGFVLPNRAQITMTVPFMRAYTELLVKTCHARGAHAMGGMAAFIPSRRDPEINEIALRKVREDKIREASDGFDGTWVAHPDLVPIAREVFHRYLGEKSNQKDRQRPEVEVKAQELLNFEIKGGEITEDGLRNNISVALQYLSSWLAGRGAVAIFNLMEDTATAEIARSQIWQWLHRPAGLLADGRPITKAMYRQVRSEELEKIKREFGDGEEKFQFDLAANLLDQLVLPADFVGFLTLIGYTHLE